MSSIMQIWVDADACPQVIKEILFRAADRAQVLTTLVSNMSLRTPSSPYVRTVRVAKGFDGADHRIMQELRSGGALLGGPAPFRQSDRHLFANRLDRFLARHRA
jgi:hypothetical protein